MKPYLCWMSLLALSLGQVLPAAAQKCGEIPSVLVIQDRSGSMKELVGGTNKWDIARIALGSLATKYGGQLSMGLMLYPRWPDTAACDPGQMTVAPATNNKSKIITALNKVTPNGNTPITTTLTAAAKLLTQSGAKVHHVILVTDGKETCLTPSQPLNQGGTCQWQNGTNYRKCGDCGWQFCLSSGVWSTACAAVPQLHPCPPGQSCGSNAKCTGTITGPATGPAAMAKLKAMGITGHVIGFGAAVDPAALKALAVAGGTSNYSPAANPAALQAALNKIVAAINCCGNGVLDPGEKCDKKIAAGALGACPTAASCSDGKACTTDAVSGADCNVVCTHSPITKPASGDGCCPPGANSGTDSDCPASCGNGVLDPGEKCDPKIPAGQTGACDLKCDDGDACTNDVLAGTACNPSCSTTPVSARAGTKDGCCPKTPANLTDQQDPDCPPPCSPTKKTGCVDLCKGKSCKPGYYCKYGKCVPYPEDSGSGPGADGGGSTADGGGGGPGATDSGEEGGCDCQVSPAGDPLPALLLLGLLLVAGRRRRRQ